MSLLTLVNAAVLPLLAVLVFVPSRYVCSSRTSTWRVAINLLGTTWACACS